VCSVYKIRAYLKFVMLNLDFFPVAGNRNRRPQDLLGPKKSNSQSSQESSLSCGSTIYVPQPFIYPSGYPSTINLSTGCSPAGRRTDLLPSKAGASGYFQIFNTEFIFYCRTWRIKLKQKEFSLVQEWLKRIALGIISFFVYLVKFWLNFL